MLCVYVWFLSIYFFYFFFFFFNDTATTEIYTLSLHDALPSLYATATSTSSAPISITPSAATSVSRPSDRKSTRLNSSHSSISYAVFCLKKKTKKYKLTYTNIIKTKNQS